MQPRSKRTRSPARSARSVGYAAGSAVFSPNVMVVAYGVAFRAATACSWISTASRSVVPAFSSPSTAWIDSSAMRSACARQSIS